MKIHLLKPLALLSLFTLSLVSCKEEEQALSISASTSAITVPFFVNNSQGEIPSAPEQLVFENRENEPILAPDGHQLTWGEFSAVQGAANVECVDGGVEVNLSLSGLIPNGVYTIWNVVFDDPGMDPADVMLGVDGLGAAGIGDGSDSRFVATNAGTATISIFSPGGPLSMLQNTQLADCPLTDNFEWHVVGAYHIDNLTYGPALGPDGAAVEQFGFIFKSENN